MYISDIDSKPHWMIEKNNGAYNQDTIITFALDRIESFEPVENIKFKMDDTFHPHSYYENIIGVTVNHGLVPRSIKLAINQENAPYDITKPIHWTQELIERNENGIVITIKLIPNYELERLLLGFGPGLEVLSPPSLRRKMGDLLKKASKQYFE